jgi:bifunctional UDP-N-acetylglucosamine pyrophosphorylase/glucosamine-1-phosphate N-acetyltransferase
MRSAIPKVLHEVCGLPMLSYVLDACRQAGIQRFCVVVGFGRERVTSYFADQPGITWVEQAEQKGTGHAVQMCEPHLRGAAGEIVIIAGDMPLVRSATIRQLLDTHRNAAAAVTLATAVLDDPTGYGRIIRDPQGRMRGIVEHRDCTEPQRAIHEVNPSYYCFDARKLLGALGRLTNNNAKGEYYLTDAVGMLIEAGERTEAVTAVPAEDAVGVNSRDELALINDIMRRRVLRRLMESGVTVVDPGTTWVHPWATVGADSIVEPFTYVERGAVIGRGCRIGPFAYVAPGARVAEGARVGPMAA